MDLEAAAAAYLHDRRYGVFHGRKTDALPCVTHFSSENSRLNVIQWVHLNEHGIEAAIEEQGALFGRGDTPLEWSVHASDTPHDLADRLVTQGYRDLGTASVMVAELPMDAFEGPKHSIECIETEEQLIEFKSLAETLFRKDFTFTTSELRAALGRRDSRHVGFLARVGTEAVAMGCLISCIDSPIAKLYCAGTLPEFRKQGAHRALTLARARYAEQLGLRWLSILAMETSRPLVERLGFVEIDRVRFLRHEPS